MQAEKQYYVYIMTNKSGTLYTGMTNNIKQRVFAHKHKLVEGFTKKYNIDRLLYIETFGDVNSAIARENTIKGWLRARKMALIKATNPNWAGLAGDWYS
ncbi:MAG: GIY-YIG nuclease family protein [Planctomycetota bacterium]|nr:GIY-YIG nuclease family protein [Planctomycetota bacterium]